MTMFFALTDASRSKIRAGDFILLAGRLLLALIFVHEGVSIVLNFSRMMQAMAQLGIGLPLAVATIALQIGAGSAIALGLLTRLGAAALGVFCLLTATLFHTNFASQNEFLHFEKDLAIAGGMFVLVVMGPGALSLDAWLRQAFAGQTPDKSSTRYPISSPSAGLGS